MKTEEEKAAMADKHRFKKNREFKQRLDEESENEEADIRSFTFHRHELETFKRKEDSRPEKRTERGWKRDDYDRDGERRKGFDRDGKRGKGFDRDGKRGKGFDRDSKFGRGFDRDGGFKRRDGGRPFDRKRPFDRRDDRKKGRRDDDE